MSKHRCALSGCDGTRLGHELARDFPGETARFDDAMSRIVNREDHVKPENLEARDE